MVKWIDKFTKNDVLLQTLFKDKCSSTKHSLNEEDWSILRIHLRKNKKGG